MPVREPVRTPRTTRRCIRVLFLFSQTGRGRATRRDNAATIGGGNDGGRDREDIDELDNYGGQFLYAAKGVGVTAWGMNLLRLPPNWPDYPEHDHAEQDQEEVYVILDGKATLHADGESWEMKPGMLARVGSSQKRKFAPSQEGVTILAIGGTPGKAYEPRR